LGSDSTQVTAPTLINALEIMSKNHPEPGLKTPWRSCRGTIPRRHRERLGASQQGFPDPVSKCLGCQHRKIIPRQVSRRLRGASFD